ncbi:MAG: hypothetical protein KAH77_12430 [Thiomargarita sp.]|nr:hypothetical protein [Thiomargarita sp.]
MTKIHKELEKRLNTMEIEQIKQDGALHGLKDLDGDVERLNTLLSQMDRYEIGAPEQKSNFNYLRNGTEVKRLEDELAHIDKTQQEMPSNDIETEFNLLDDELDKTDAIKEKREGYIICLMFDPETPTEWSGSGWRSKGNGKCYSMQQAKDICYKLKQQWPNYPLTIKLINE